MVLALTPWNDPVAVAAGLLGAAIVSGDVVVHKPSERSPGTGALFTSILAEALPDGVLTLVEGNGTVGDELARTEGVDVLAHVGSTATGRALARVAAVTGAHVILENGGNDALVIDRDVDPVWAAEQAALGAFANAGQICTSVERIYVHRDIADAFTAALVVEADRWSAGSLPASSTPGCATPCTSTSRRPSAAAPAPSPAAPRARAPSIPPPSSPTAPSRCW